MILLHELSTTLTPFRKPGLLLNHRVLRDIQASAYETYEL